MRTEEWSRVQPILEELLEHSEDEREAILARRVGDDSELRRRVLALIERDEREEAELKSPFAGVSALRSPGDAIGPYRLQERIGQGGMGEVWRVEREDEHFRMQAALKLIRSGMATDEILRRFKRERQVQASLDHPGIARLLDGGATADGLPYTVMELVDGQPIDDYCRARGLPVRDRLELFAQVCDAVQHAHASLVVHRDLKPSNVLVTPEGQCKLLDFGIAKLLSPDEDEASLLTLTGQRLLTPRYASPEQVRGEVVGTASDVYSLGVLLYELLTERSPYGENLTGSDLETAICARDPLRPSASTTAGRSTNRRLRGDLDNIVLMALRKEKSRRYSSAEALADDVRRHLDGLPVRARPDTIRYRTNRFVRRNRLLLGATTGVFLSLVIGLIVSARMYVRAEAKSVEATWQAYVASIAAVDASLGSGHHVREARQRLENAPLEPRGWEYEYLAQRLDRSLWFMFSAGRALTVEISPDCRWVASASGFPGGRSFFQLWDGRTGEMALRAESTQGPFSRDIAFSPDGGHVASVADDGTLFLWSLETQAPEITLDLETGALRTVAFHPDGDRLAIGATDGSVWTWTVGAAEATRIAPGNGEATVALAYAEDGERLFAAYLDGLLRVSDSATGDELGHLRCGAEVISMALDEPEDLLVLSTSDGFVRRYRLSTLTEIGRVPSPAGAVGVPRLSDDGALAAVASEDRAILVFETRFGSVVGDLRGNRSWSTSIWAVDFSPDGSLVATGTWDYEIRFWDVQGSPVSREQTGHGHNVLDLAVHPGGKLLASASQDGTVRIWDARSGLVLRVLDAHGDEVSCVAFSPDGRRLVSGSSDGSSRIWDTRSWTTTRILEGWSTAATFSPDGERLALGGGAGRLGLLSAPFDGEVQWTDTGAGPILDVGFAPGGLSLATAHAADEDEQATLVVWDVETRLEVVRFPADDSEVVSASFSLSGEHLLSATERGHVVLRDAATWKVLAERKIPGSKDLGELTYSRDGRRIVVPATYGTTGIWDAHTLADVFLLGGHRYDVYCAEFAPGGGWLATAGKDDTVRFWTARSAKKNAVPTLVRRLADRLVLNEDIAREIERHAWLDAKQKQEALEIVQARQLDLDELDRHARRLLTRTPNLASFREALDVANALCRSAPDRPDFLVTRGRALLRLGVLEEAEACLVQALEAGDEKDAECALLATAFLAMARHGLGDGDAATLLDGIRAEGASPEARRVLREARVLVLAR